MIDFILLLLCFNTLNNALAVDLYNETWSCNSNFTNLKGQSVNLTQYCTDKPCLTKCCGENEIVRHVNGTATCSNVTAELRKLLINSNITYDYSDFEFYKSDINTEVTLSTKNFLKDFNLVPNNVPLNINCGVPVPVDSGISKILDNGMMALDHQNLKIKRWEIKETSTFCVELVLYSKSGGVNRGIYYVYILNEPETNTDNSRIINFLQAGFLISSFFLLLVLLVYCMLPQRRNLAGMILMVYVATMLVVYLMRTVHLFIPGNMHIDTCKTYSPILYFFILSSFLWLNIMSFNIWWTFSQTHNRAVPSLITNYKRAINRQGEVVKFLWYCLYAWGVAAAMTTAAVLIDRANLTDWPRIIRPSFEACYGNHDPNLLYLSTPMGILTAINIVLFLMTVHNFWLIRKELNKVSGSSNNKNTEMRYRIYVRLSLMMGLSWALEVVQNFFEDFGLWLFVIVNLYNILIGVAIFFVFVFNVPTLEMLCKRFNIKMKFVDDWKSNRQRTTVSRLSTSKGSFSSTKSKTTQVDVKDTESADVSMIPSGPTNKKLESGLLGIIFTNKC